MSLTPGAAAACPVFAQLERGARGHLIVCHNPEKHDSNLSAEDLWGDQHAQNVQENHDTSRSVLAEWLLKVGAGRARCALSTVRCVRVQLAGIARQSHAMLKSHAMSCYAHAAPDLPAFRACTLCSGGPATAV